MHNTLGILIPVLLVVAFIAFYVFLFWRISKKTGYHGAMGLIALIPGIGMLIALCILVFSKWPMETEVEQLRMRQGMMPPTGYPPQGQPQPSYMQYPSQSPQQYP